MPADLRLSQSITPESYSALPGRRHNARWQGARRNRRHCC
jgi:hypothetical protein